MEISKEVLQELGWEHTIAFWYDWPIKNIDIPEYSSRSLDFRLNWVDAKSYLSIHAYERNSFDWETVFAGPIKTKEELEFLMKMFKLI